MFKRTDLAGLTSYDSFFNYDDRQFEYACKYLLEETAQAKSVFVTSKGPKGGDGGIDLKIHLKDGPIIYGQCKLWRSRYRGLIATINQLSGCLRRDKIDRGILMITVPATDYEKREAAKCDIEIIDAPALDALIAQLRTSNQPVLSKVSAVQKVCIILKFILIVITFLLICIVAAPLLLLMLLLAALAFSGNISSGGGSKYYRRNRRHKRRSYRKYRGKRTTNGWGVA
ncbi:MAG TPA: restriction endonuclease [Candidatus Peribacteraceae bacterium]|nr:restriction endonuclease [Candidatus Peribacteraceae bacterium]